MESCLLKTKNEILNWLEKNDSEYKDNIRNNTYEFIDIHDDMNQALLEEMIKKDNLIEDFFENLKSEGHQYILNVKGSVDIYVQQLKEIPIQFYHVVGYSYCSDNLLKSLKGSPQSIGKSFSCLNNHLTSLEYCPQSIGGDFDCSYNKISSLEYFPQLISGNFDCSYNYLRTLTYCPKKIEGNFTFSYNQLKTLKDCPYYIGGKFWCDHNQLKTLDYFPEYIGSFVLLHNNHELELYKNQSNDLNIKNMSEEAFLSNKKYSFWYYFHLQEKIKQENNKIIEDLDLKDNIEKNKLILIRSKKV